jgi:hypothetical protein
MANTNGSIFGFKIIFTYNLIIIFLKYTFMKYLYVLASIAIISILASCGNDIIEPIIQSWSTDVVEQTPVVLTPEEEDIITELLEEIEGVLGE